MISYKLAKELKDAGFPQLVKQGYMVHDWVNYPDAEHYYEPTVSELIEACGEGFEQLQRNYTGEPMGGPGKWLACHTPDNGETSDCVVADSAEEAVAKLWLELQRLTALRSRRI
jgi:hypothetical protein